MILRGFGEIEFDAPCGGDGKKVSYLGHERFSVSTRFSGCSADEDGTSALVDVLYGYFDETGEKRPDEFFVFLGNNVVVFFVFERKKRSKSSYLFRGETPEN